MSARAGPTFGKLLCAFRPSVVLPLADLTDRAGLRPRTIDGLAVRISPVWRLLIHQD
jgi:hypothetical protein